MVDLARAILFGVGERMLAWVVRYGATPTPHRNVEIIEQGVMGKMTPTHWTQCKQRRFMIPENEGRKGTGRNIERLG